MGNEARDQALAGQHAAETKLGATMDHGTDWYRLGPSGQGGHPLSGLMGRAITMLSDILLHGATPKSERKQKRRQWVPTEAQRLQASA